MTEFLIYRAFSALRISFHFSPFLPIFQRKQTGLIIFHKFAVILCSYFERWKPRNCLHFGARASILTEIKRRRGGKEMQNALLSPFLRIERKITNGSS